MSKYLSGFVAVVGLLLLLSVRTEAATLYGASAAGGSGILYTLNPTDGSVLSTIGLLNDTLGSNYSITGLAFSPVSGLLYGSTGNVGDHDATLVTINPTTALVSVIGLYNAGPTNSGGVPATMSDLSFTSAGNLFGIGSIAGPQLYSINILTGQATVIGDTGLTATSGGGLAIDASGTFFGTPTTSRFGTYNSATGAYTNITNPAKPLGGAYAALAINPDTGLLYGLNLGPGPASATHLVTINGATGSVTDLGASASRLDAIAFSAGATSSVPEPISATLILIAFAAIYVCRRHASAVHRKLEA